MGWGGVRKLTCSSVSCEQVTKLYGAWEGLGVKRKVRTENDMFTLGRALGWLEQEVKWHEKIKVVRVEGTHPLGQRWGQKLVQAQDCFPVRKSCVLPLTRREPEWAELRDWDPHPSQAYKNMRLKKE